MKERPILFSTPMIQAILDGRKTMTRRIKGLEELEFIPFDESPVMNKKPFQYNDDWYYEVQVAVDDSHRMKLKCPYGQVGDILWVRETWNTLTTYLEKPDYSVMSIRDFVYKADNDRIDKWKPSIFMPREACRIMLEITNIRVERLQDISEQDAISEGIIHKSMNYPVIEFQHLWQFINGHESWETNPWVWVIEFKKIDL